MRLSSSALEILRKQPQSTKLYLSVFQPQAVFKARINDATIDKGERVIAYDSVTLGSFTSLVANATLWIGSSDGDNDVGKIRIRSATSSTITVSENENIEWADNLYLTGFYFVELWPIFPRIIQSGTDDVTFFKDWDISYSNQNSILGTYVNAGPHRAGFAGDQLYYSSTGTYNLLGNSLNYNWTFEGGTPSSSSSANPGYVSYPTAGNYVTRLQISGSNGAVDTTYRYVAIRDRIGQGSNPPVVKWELMSMGGSRDEGGYKASFKVYEDVDIQENSVVVIFADDWYGDTNQSFGGNYPNGEKIFFVGYVLEDSIHYDYQHSYVEFSTASLTQLMKESLGFSVSVESVASPDVWYELLDMDCRRAIYHYLRWHTTAMQIGDFQFVGEDRKIQFFDADRNSMYDAIDNLMRGTLIGKAVSDRQGKTWLEVDAKATPSPTASFVPVMGLGKRDWMNEPTITERLSDDLSYLEYGGIAYSGVVTGTFSAILSAAPGNTPSFRGNIETHEGLALLGQAQLNELVGNVWANENSDYPKINMELGIDARNLDIAPQETTNVSILASETVRGIAISGYYIPVGIDWKYDSRNSILLPTLDLQALVDGNDGQTIEIADPTVGGGFIVPSLQIPPLPPLTVPAFTIPTGTISSIVTTQILAFQSDYGRYIVNSASASVGSRGITIDSIVLTSGLSGANFVLSQSGLYFVSAYWSQDSIGVTPGLAITGDMQIVMSGQSLRVQAKGIADLFGIATVNGSTSGVVYGGGTIQFVLTSGGGGTLITPDMLGFSVARISA